ncbi:C2 domain [Trypanosoma melophagium]|uniref:C2 domain n=1 Tax=Trypanosoma melophagium TaxID=715481 RepID=UPI00351A5F2B|nr:C2 domain [Trypanosoma melophagium]
MGKLFITVNKCHLFRSPELETVNLRIRIVVDGVYKFSTKTKRDGFASEFDETFTVGNTHRLAVVDVLAFNCLSSGSNEKEELLGTCRVSVEKLVQGKKRTRNFPLASKDNSGIAGTVNITLQTDAQGGASIPINDTLEERYLNRLTRFFLCWDRTRLSDVDLLLASVRDDQSVESLLNVPPVTSSLASQISRDTYASFDDLMLSLCKMYKCQEPPNYKLSLIVEGCANLTRPAMYLPSSVVVVIRSSSQEFITPVRPFTVNPVWGKPAGLVEIDIVDPSSSVLDVMVYYFPLASKEKEVGRSQVRVSTLIRDHASARPVFIFSQTNEIIPVLTGMVYLTMKPINFGLIPMKVAEHIDGYYERLTRFFYRYDPRRIQQVDLLIQSRLDNLSEFMTELEYHYGREPGTIELWVCVQELHSIQLDPVTDLNDKEVIVIITMGDQVVRTQPKKVFANSRTLFGDTFVFDVARETDMIKFQVIRANREDIVYGRVDVTCLKIQRGVHNNRMLYLVGAAGTPDAYLSGMIGISLFSEQLGQPYAVDETALHLYAGRLRRYVYRRVPEKLHLVNTAVDTLFDIEGFLRDVSREYGEEDKTYAVYLTVLGCRQLRTRFGFSMNAYVAAKMGIERYETHVVKDSTEPDFFDFFEFQIDRLNEAHLTLVVMDMYDLGADKEVGRVVIPLGNKELEVQHHEWIPLVKPDNSSQGIIGVRYVLKDLNLRDEARTYHNSDDTLRQNAHVVSLIMEGGHARRISMTRRSRISGLRNKLARVTAQFQLPGRFSRNTSIASSDASSIRTSERDLLSHEPLNLMNASIHSVNEFCFFSKAGSSSRSLTPSPSFVGSESTVLTKRPLKPLGRGGKWLHVRLLYCDNLDDAKQIPPNPYVMLSTLCKSHFSKRAFSTISPRYNEEFIFPVFHPNEDYIAITVVTDTPYGKKCLGHCLLSMKNVQKGTPRTRHVSLVVAPSRPVAVQRGTVCLTLLGENFGLDYMPSVNAESRLAESLQKYLVSHAPRELHRLEWFVGEYSLRENELVKSILSKYDAKSDEEIRANVKLTIKALEHLYYNNKLVVSGTCFVKIKEGKKTLYCTRSVQGANGFFIFQEECILTISHPLTKTLRVVIHMEGSGATHKCGECVLSIAALHQNAIQERTHFIVKNAGLPSAIPVGYFTVSLLSDNFGTLVSPHFESNESQYDRLRDYYYYYIREQLHTVDVKFSTTLNLEEYIKKLTEKYGPEPGNYHLRVKVMRCYFLSVEPSYPYCIVQVGLLQYKTNIAYGEGEHVFMESFDLKVGLPEKEEVQLIVFLVKQDSSVISEVGRTVLPLKSIIRGEETQIKLPLVNQASSKIASINGAVDVSFFTNDFGISSDNHRNNNGSSAYERLELEMARFPPQEMHMLPNILTESQGPGEFIVPSITENRVCYSNLANGDPVHVLLLGLYEFPVDEVYIKIRMNGSKAVLRTGILKDEKIRNLREGFTLDPSLDLNETVFTMKIAINKLHGSYPLCYCDFMLAHFPRGRISKKYLHLFTPKGVPMGHLCLQVDMPPSPSRSPEPPSLPSPYELERVSEDLASLMLKHNPQDLRKLDLMLTHNTDLRGLHRILRQQLAPRVQATVYCIIHDLALTAALRGHRLVEAAVRGDVSRGAERKPTTPAAPRGVPRGVTDRPLRIDFAPDGGPLLLRVLGDGGDAAVDCRVRLSLRALLTSQLYDLEETVTVPIVRVRRRRKEVQADLAGTITFSLRAPLFESYPRTIPLFDNASRRVNRAFVRYYLNRIYSLLKHYDANSLVDIHHIFYENYVAKDTWATEVPNLLYALIERWGPEVEDFPLPPPAEAPLEEISDVVLHTP